MGGIGGRVSWYYRLNMSEMSSTSVSAAAIFSAEDSCGRLPKRNDIVNGLGCSSTSYIDGETCYLLCDSFDIGRTMFVLCGGIPAYVIWCPPAPDARFYRFLPFLLPTLPPSI